MWFSFAFQDSFCIYERRNERKDGAYRNIYFFHQMIIASRSQR